MLKLFQTKGAMQTLSDNYGLQQTDQIERHHSHAPPLLDEVSVEAEFQAFKHQMFMVR